MIYYILTENALLRRLPWRLPLASVGRYCSYRQKGRGERFPQRGFSV